MLNAVSTIVNSDFVAEWIVCCTHVQNTWLQIAVAKLSGNSLRQTVHTHYASVHQAAKSVAAILRVAGVTAGLAESNDSLPPDLWLTSPAGWLPRTGISSGTLHSVIEYGLHLRFFLLSGGDVRGVLWSSKSPWNRHCSKQPTQSIHARTHLL